MKTTLLLVLCVLIVGCTTTDKEKTCDTYSKVYSLYLASLAVREPSNEEIAVAAAATFYLTAYCGWSNIQTKDRSGIQTDDRSGILVDHNGVPVITR